MLQRIGTVAFNAYREAVRARVLLGLAGVAAAVAVFSMAVAAWTLGDAPRVIADLGSMSISVFSLAVAILVAATSLHRELEMKTILPLLARPIRRSEYLVGKYLGTMLVVAVFVMANAGLVLIMSAAMAGQKSAIVAGVLVALALALAALSATSRSRTFGPIPWSMAAVTCGVLVCNDAPQEQSLVFASSLLTLLEVAIVAAIALFFSSFSTPFLSSLLTLGTFVVGRSADGLNRLPKTVYGEFGKSVGKAMSTAVPNLHVYTPARPLLTGEALDADLFSYVGMAGVQALGWVVGLLAVSAFIFQRRDFL